MNKESVISKVYYDTNTGFGSIAKTHAAAKKIDPSIKREHVKEFLDKQEIRQGKKRRGYNSFVPFAPREEYQFDLADFGVSAEKYRYAFVCIDSFSKMLDVVPIENKRPEECVRALNIVIEKMHTPQYAYTDDGGEFKGAFEERLKYYFIEHIATRAHAPFAERVIRTLREGLSARLAASKTPKGYWWRFVDPVVKQYNETTHVTTGEAPNDIHHLTMEEDKDLIEELRDRIAGKGKSDRKYPQINVGDHVKVMRKPGKYGEHKIGFVAWSKDAYRVGRIEYQDGEALFYLEGSLDSRPYRLHEILKVKGVEAPPATRITSKQAPKIRPVTILREAVPKTVSAAPPKPVARRLREKTKQPPPTRRLRTKTHPLAAMIT